MQPLMGQACPHFFNPQVRFRRMNPNSHHPRQFQDVLGETPNIGASRVGKLDGRLSNGIAVVALIGDTKHDVTFLPPIGSPYETVALPRL